MKLQGFCPMGCGATLRATRAGHVYCEREGCPDRLALAEKLLEKRQSMERVFASLEFAAVAREAISARVLAAAADPDSKATAA